MYVSNDVRVYKNVQIFFSSFFIIFIFDAKVEKGEFQLASTTNRWLKAFYMWSTQTQQTTLTDDEKKLYNVPVSLSDESSSIPLQSKHRCYCLVRWFWSSTLHRGINNKRQYSWSNRKSRYFVRKKGENSIKRMTK